MRFSFCADNRFSKIARGSTACVFEVRVAFPRTVAQDRYRDDAANSHIEHIYRWLSGKPRSALGLCTTPRGLANGRWQFIKELVMEKIGRITVHPLNSKPEWRRSRRSPIIGSRLAGARARRRGPRLQRRSPQSCRRSRQVGIQLVGDSRAKIRPCKATEERHCR